MYFYGKYAVVVDMADWKKNWDSDHEALNCQKVIVHLSNENPPTEDEFPMYLQEGPGWGVKDRSSYWPATKEECAAAYKKYLEAELKAVDKLLGKS